jgi:hypothetical protein
MDLRAWTWTHLGAAWLAGAALAALLLWAGRVDAQRSFGRMQRASDAAARAYGEPSAPGAARGGSGNVNVIHTFTLPADSPEAQRLARAMRRREWGGAVWLGAALAVPLALVALTAWWAWLRRAG